MAKKVAELIPEYLNGFLEQEGLELYHVEFQKEGKDWYLRVFIDTKDPDTYVDVDSCEKVSRYLSEVMDKEDPIEQNYMLEVSSPGMDRELFTEEHFKRYAGETVDVKLFKAVNGEKIIEGELVEKTDEGVTLKLEDGEVINLPKDAVAKVQLAVII